MLKRFYIGKYKVGFSFARIEKVGGYNSTLRDGNHILMWDFDNTSLDEVKKALLKVQLKYELPRIHILETKQNSNYIAYCFDRLPWRQAARIVFDTDGVDYQFIRFSVYREKFTLRMSAKEDRSEPYLVALLPGIVPLKSGIDELINWVKYETIKRKEKR